MTERNEPPVLLRVGEAARLLSVSRSTAYSLASSGELPGAVRVGTSLRVHRETLLRALAERALAPPGERK